MSLLSTRRKIWNFLSLRHVFIGAAYLLFLLKTNPKEENLMNHWFSAQAERMAQISQAGCSYFPSGMYHNLQYLTDKSWWKFSWNNYFNDSYFLEILSKCVPNSPKTTILNIGTCWWKPVFTSISTLTWPGVLLPVLFATVAWF
jgi:hypothetical protein